MTWLFALPGKIKLYAVLIASAIGAFLMAYFRGKSEGKKDAQNDALKDTQKRVEKGRKAVIDGRSSRDNSPADRLRRNDGRW